MITLADQNDLKTLNVCLQKTYVYKKNDEIVSYVTISYHKTATIDHLYTYEQHRKNGYAIHLMLFVLKMLELEGYKQVNLLCEQDKVTFYEQLGFKLKIKNNEKWQEMICEL